MGKQNRSWIPPEDDEIIDQEKPAAKTVWMPPAQDEVVEEPVKKKEPAGAASVTPAVKDGVPSGANTAQVSPEQQRDLANLKLDEPRPVPKGSLESDLKNKALEVAQTFRTSRQALDTPAEALINTVKSGIADQIPKEYYAQRLRMSKGSFGDLFDPRSNLNAFGDKLPAGISRDEFARWSNQNRDKVLGKSYDERAQAFLTEKLGTDGYERMKVAFQQENQQERSGFEEEVQQQNKEAAQRTAGVVQNLKDVDGAASFLNFAGNMLGQALYRAPTSILSGGVGSIVSESSAVYDRQIDLIAEKEGISRQEVIKRGLDKPAEGQALAVLAGELDALSSVNLIGLFRKAAGKELTKNLVKEFAKGFVKGGVPEALTEAAQGEIEEFAAAKGAEVDYSPDAWRIATGAAGGLIGGGLIGGASAVKLTPDQEAKSTAQVIQEEVKNPDIDTAAETIQAKVEQSGDAGVYTFTPPSTDEETQAAPVATPPQEGEVSEDQTQEALPVQEETKTVTPDDSQDQSGLQSNQREGQEPVQADTEQSGGGEASQAGGILQKEEEITGPESGTYSYGSTIQGQQEQSDMDSGSQEGQQPASVTSEQQQEQRSERVRGEPPATPEAAQTQQPSSPRTLKIAQRILDSDASEAIKRGVREKGADYIPKRLDVTDQEANDLLDLYGNDKAESVIRDTKNDLTQDTRTAMAARLYERYKGEADAATDSQQKSSLYNKAVDIALFGANQAKEAGRAVNANKIWKAITSDEDLMVLALEKENQATAQKLIEPIQQQVTQSKEQFDEQVRRMVEQKVQETVEERVKRAKLITKEQKQKISDAFDSLKVKDVGDTANDVIRVLGAAVWNGSMEAVKRAVLTGADVANAVQAGLDYIRDNYKGTFDENEYRDIVSRGITPLISVSKPISSDNIDADAVTTPRLKGKKKKQFIEQIVDEYNKKGQITDDRFEQIYAKQLGFKEFSDEDRARIRDLAKVISETEKFAEVVKNSSGADLRQNIAKYKTLLDKARKANKELQEFARKPSNVWDTLITIMQGNLLTPLSIVTNVYSNAALQPLRFLSTGIGSLVDRSISGLAKMDLMSRSYKDPTIDLVAVQKGFAPGIWDGTIEGWKQLKEGQLTSDKDLREIQSGFDPVAAVKRWSDEDRELSQKINDAIEGTLGFPAEGMFRLLNFGDKPFRRAAELGRAMEIADRKKLTGDEKIKFLMFPDEASAAEIDKAGKQATFQQETELSKKVQKYITDFLNLAQSVPYIGGPIKILLKSQIPYVKTPLNIVIETFDYALPPITFGRGVYSILKGNRRAGAVLIGKAVVGAIIMTVARQLFQMGLLSWEDDKDKKGRNIQYDSVPPASMNVDALARGLTGQGWEIKDDDTWIAYKKMGVAGILFNNYTNNYFRSLKDEEQMPGFMEEMVTSAPRVLSSSLEQSFLKGTNSFLNALQDQGGYETQQWAIETAGAISSIVLPNTIATISKSSDEYIRDTYNRDFTDRLAATFKAKVFMGGQLPPKVNLWGEKVTGNPEGRNKYAYYLFDPTKFKNVDTDSYKWKLYEAWRGDNFNPEWLPAQPTRSLKVRGINMKLSPKEFELFSTFIGQERARAVQGYINSGWRYQKPEQRIERLKELYAEGRERGKQKFLMQTGWGVMTPKKLEAINENR